MDTKDIHNLIKELVEMITNSATEITITEEKKESLPNTTIWFSIETKEPHLFLSREAEALTSFNHLVRKIIEVKILSKKEPKNDLNNTKFTIPEILIDINGYQKKKIENIHNIAHMMAERARYFKSNIEIDPMSSFERRIVHEFLSNATDLKTESEGVGNSRRVVIKYIGTI